MKTLVSGDIHGQHDFHKLSNHRLVSEFGALPDILIVAGDFGAPWSNNPDDPEDNYILRWYGEKPYKVLVIPGNHENYSRIQALPSVTVFGAKAHQWGQNIFFIEKNEVLNIEGKTFYCFGGATSTDKEQRILYQSWWPEEDATYADFISMQEKLEIVKSVDFVVSHTCPEKWVPLLGPNFHSFDNCPTRKLLDNLESHLNYGKWFFGHFHRDQRVGDKGHCLYEKLKEVT
jgi:DNA repair exonuclease SbcCD nuclease subunit